MLDLCEPSFPVFFVQLSHFMWLIAVCSCQHKRD